jgi:hypothetical protein
MWVATTLDEDGWQSRVCLFPDYESAEDWVLGQIRVRSKKMVRQVGDAKSTQMQFFTEDGSEHSYVIQKAG